MSRRLIPHRNTTVTATSRDNIPQKSRHDGFRHRPPQGTALHLMTCERVLIITSVRSNMVKCRIDDLSSLAAANRFVQSWHHLIHGSLRPCESASQTASRSVLPFLHNTSLWPTQTTLRVTSVVIHRIYAMRAMRLINNNNWSSSPSSRFALAMFPSSRQLRPALHHLAS